LSEGNPQDLDFIRPTVIDIDLDALEANYRRICEIAAPAAVMPILKANAYGHGLVPCARRLESLGARAFGVAFLEEGITLRRAGIKTPILALGGISGRQIGLFLQYDIDLTASSVYKLEAIERKAEEMGKTARVHLKVDTGMERIGVHYYSAGPLLEKAIACRHCEISGIFSHFATAEDEDLSFARLQLERFLECASFFEKHSLPAPLRHMANSGAILQFPESALDLVRPGLILFGVSPAPHLAARSPQSRVMSVRSEVVYFKVVAQGAGVSYGRAWQAPCQTRVVTIPVGYGDGYSRRLSNNGSVLIRGIRYPIAGRVCMDQFMVDIGPSGAAYNGDEVVLIGRQGGEEITVEEISMLAGTDPRDILASLNLRIPRRYYSGGQAVSG